MLISFSNLRRKYNMDIKGIIHIGAHYGEEIKDYIDEGIQNVVVFEPLPDNFDILCENSQDLNANIEGYQVALGSKEGESSSGARVRPSEHTSAQPRKHGQQSSPLAAANR